MNAGVMRKATEAAALYDIDAGATKAWIKLHEDAVQRSADAGKTETVFSHAIERPVPYLTRAVIDHFQARGFVCTTGNDSLTISWAEDNNARI